MRYIRNDSNGRTLNKHLKTLEDCYIFPLGDVHTGASTAKKELFKQYLELGMSLDNAIFYWMGDLIEMGGRSSPGTSLFHQTMQPQAQYDWVIDTLKDTVSKSVVFHGANHERRAEIATGLDVTKNLARHLGIPYAPYGAVTRIVLKNQSYNIHSFHGSAGARLPHTKIKAFKDATMFMQGFDLFLMGHVHYNHAEKFLIKRPDTWNKKIETVEGYRVMTGHFLEWDESYGEEKQYEPLPNGAPILELSGLKHKISVRTYDDIVEKHFG